MILRTGINLATFDHILSCVSSTESKGENHTIDFLSIVEILTHSS